MPFDEDEFVTAHRELMNFIFDSLDKRTKELVDTQKSIELRRDLTIMMEREYKERLDRNQEQSISRCQQFL